MSAMVQPHIAARLELNDLMTQVAQGDRQSFFALYREASPRLFALAIRLTRRRDRAEEIIQEAFIRIWTRARDWDEERGTAMTWMVSIVRNRAIDVLRKDVRTAAFDSELSREYEFHWITPQPDQVSADDRSELHMCIDRLDNHQKNTVCLAYFEGLSHEQLAERLDAPLGTVKSWLRRGLLRLRQCLDHE